MASRPDSSRWPPVAPAAAPPLALPEVVTRAAALLAKEVARSIPDGGAFPAMPLASAKGAPRVPDVAGLADVPGIPGMQGFPAPAFGSPVDIDQLRRHLHDYVETLLSLFVPKAPADGDRVPMLRCNAAVKAGEVGTVTVRVANDEAAPASVSLYTSNFVADGGYDIPSARVTSNPRSVTIPSRGEASFQLNIATPAQAPAGVYSGLVQAAGATYVKAVISIEVK
jgi:hypothetical protein